MTKISSGCFSLDSHLNAAAFQQIAIAVSPETEGLDPNKVWLVPRDRLD